MISSLRRLRGFTLLELLLTLGAIAILTTAALVAGHIYNQRATTQVAVSGEQQMARQVVQTLGESGSYSDLSPADLVVTAPRGAGFTVQGNTVAFKNWGNLQAEPRAGGRGFALTLPQVPSGNCTSFAMGLAGAANGFQVEVNGATVDSVAKAAAACKGKDVSSVSLVSPVKLASTNFGEVAMPADHGGSVPVLPDAPALDTSGTGSLDAVAAAPETAWTPAAPVLNPVAPQTGLPVVGAVTNPGSPASLPPATALPPPTCVPSSIPQAATASVEQQTQTVSCTAGLLGTVVQVRSRTNTTQPTLVTSCPAGAWGTPASATTQAVTSGPWSAWTTASSSCVAPTPPPPAITGFEVGIYGGYNVGEGPKPGMKTCTGPTFNTFVLWSAGQGNPADSYTLTMSRAGHTVTKTLTSGQIECAAACAGNGSLLTSAEARAFTPDTNWATLVYDHTEPTGAPGGIRIIPWMEDMTVTLQACNKNGCSSTTRTSADLAIYSNGQHDCTGGGYPATARP